MTEFYGKYEGTVEQNLDPLGKGRLLVKVAAVFRDGKVWAMPCVPYAGSGIGFFAMPPKDAHVWVEFAGGDPNRPIWSGCFWGEGESTPASVSPLAAMKKILKTDSCIVTLDDTPATGGITIEFGALKIEIKSQGIEVTNGKGATIKLTGPQVTINNGALEVK